MRTLKHAILGLLNQSDMTGYELTKQFETTLSEFWYTTHSHIYPELKKLTEEGCVEFHVEISGTSLEKKVYAITQKGRDEFIQWLNTQSQMKHTPKDESRLKIFFSQSLPENKQIEMLEDQLDQHTKRLEHLKNNQKKFTQVPNRHSHEFGDYMVLMGAIMREETTCEWLKKCLVLCNEKETVQP